MGLLQSCQNGGDNRLSVSLDSSMFRQGRISTNFNATDFYFQQSKVNLFGDIFYKKAGDKTQFVLQTHFTNRVSQVISHTMKIYTDSAAFMHQKGSKIKIVHSIDDLNYIGKQIYIIKLLNKPHQTYLKLVPFNRYQDQKFKQALYQISMLHKALRQQNNRYGFVYQDAYVVESGIDKDQNDKCLVIVGDCVNASLNQIITFKKMAQVPWSQKQFQALCYQLIRGTLQLHKNNIAHRDIRPQNIFYSPMKKGYVFGGYNNSVSLGKTIHNIGYNLAGVPYYMPQYLYGIGKRQDFSQYYNYDPYQYDTYSLGLTLLNALFLDQFMPPQILRSAIQKHATKYRFLKTICNMISQNPPPLSQALAQLGSVSNIIEQKNSIDALRYKLKPQDQQFVNKKKNIAQGYYQMFMYDQWVQQINQVVNYYQLNHDNMQLAEIYKQIADIYSQHHQQQMMIQYYSRASSIYLQISGDCIEQKKNQQAIQYLQKGIDCNRKGYRGQANTDLAYLLNKLAMAHHIKAQYQIARAFQQQSLDIIAKVNGQNSPQYAQMLADSAKIQMQFQQFKQAQNMLKAGLKIIDRKDENKQNQVIKAKLLESLGSTFRMKAIQRRQKCEVYRKKAQDCLLDALDITQKIQGSIHPQVGSILLNLGNVYFDRKQFDKAKKSYQKSLIVKQHTNKGRQSVQIGECLTYLANSQKLLKEYDKSIKHYDQAVQVFRKAYGNDHNQNTAVAIGNLGLVYKQLGRRYQQKQYITLAKNILKDLYGQQCPDYQYFDRQMTR